MTNIVQRRSEREMRVPVVYDRTADPAVPGVCRCLLLEDVDELAKLFQYL